MVRKVCVCWGRRGGTIPKCLQCPLLGVKVIKCLGKCQSTFLTFCGPETCSLPPDSPKGTSCQQLVCFCFFISQILHYTAPSCHILDKQMIYYNIFVAFVFIFLLSGFFIKSPGCHDNKLGCHAGISRLSHLM